MNISVNLTQNGSGSEPATAVYLLGLVDYESCLALQQRLVYEAGDRADGRIVLLLCEHPDLITVGRQGSWAHLHADPHDLARREITVRFVGRGGGCVAHTPGQLAIYPIVPLSHRGLTVGNYLSRLEIGIAGALAEVGVATQTRPGHLGVWGRSGQLASLGVAVKDWIAWHGAFINVAPSPASLRMVAGDPIFGTRMSSLAAERRQRIKMTQVREAVIRRLTVALDASRFHLFTGHPLLKLSTRSARATISRAG